MNKLKNNLKIIVYCITLFGASLSFSQNTFDAKFRFFKNGQQKSTKNLKVCLVNNLDTILCQISKDSINLPISKKIFSIVLKTKNKTYIVDNVDFEKVKNDVSFVFGVENTNQNFVPIAATEPDLYEIYKTGNFIKIENLEKSDKIIYVSFIHKAKTNSVKTVVSSYSMYSKIKK